MANSRTSLGFAYGEALEGPAKRSLGLRRLVPTEGNADVDEAEGIARKLQAAKVPAAWKPSDLFVTVILASGRRFVGLVRYGLTDAAGRAGGIEVAGAIVLADADLASWDAELRRLRVDHPTLDTWPEAITADAEAQFAEVSLTLPPLFDGSIRLAGTHPADPDRFRGWLVGGKIRQWLPWIDEGFPLADLAKRGPIVAWVPQVNVLAAPKPPAKVGSGGRWLYRSLVLLLLAGNSAGIGYLVREKLHPIETPPPIVTVPPPIVPVVSAGEAEDLGRALYDYLLRRNALPEQPLAARLAGYEKLATRDARFRVTTMEAKQGLGAVVELAARKSPAQTEAIVRGLNGDKKGIDDAVLKLIAEKLFERLRTSDE